MKIIQFKAENFKNLKCVEITPDGNLVQLTGRNGAGKSAVLEAIFTTLTGTRIDDPIRHGEEKAEVVIDMGQYTVRRNWTAKGEYLKVEGLPKGETPQGFLDKIIGKLSFDPLEFKNMKPTQQIEILKKMVGLDFTDLDEEFQNTYAERQAINSNARDLHAQLKNSIAPKPTTPDDLISYKDQLQALGIMREKQKAFKTALEGRKNIEDGIVVIETDLRAKHDQIAILQGEIKALSQALGEDQAKLVQFVLPEAITDIQIQATESELEGIEVKNVEINAAKRHRQLLKDVDKRVKEADLLSQRIERIAQDKQTRIANAYFPVPGMSLGSDAVMLNGTALHRLSTGEQIVVSTAIGMKLNPELKVIFIHEGSELDSNNLAVLTSMAQAEGYTIWMTKVENDGKVGIYLEDGTITSVDGKAVEQPVECTHEVIDPETGKCAACGGVNNHS